MYSDRDFLMTLCITHIFETGTPLGNSATVAVLKDKAGISYGKSQDTHRSGNLAKVIQFYIDAGAHVLHYEYFRGMLPTLRKTDPQTVLECQRNENLKQKLREAGKTREMVYAQELNIKNRMKKALDACEGSEFTTPMALAVIYDSINHGSFELIRDRVRLKRSAFNSALEFEKAWITQYVTSRDEWLENHPRKDLRPTDYRTDFFLLQLQRKNWQLKTPMNVHGFKLEEKHIAEALQDFDQPDPAQPALNISIEPDPISEPEPLPEPQNDLNDQARIPDAPPENDPPAPQPENKEVIAPLGQRLADKVGSWFGWLGLAPPSVAGAVALVKSYTSDGQLNFAEMLALALQVFYFVFPYVAYIAIAYIVYSILKMIFVQISFIVTLWITGDPKKNNLTVIANPSSEQPASPGLLQRAFAGLTSRGAEKC